MNVAPLVLYSPVVLESATDTVIGYEPAVAEVKSKYWSVLQVVYTRDLGVTVTAAGAFTVRVAADPSAALHPACGSLTLAAFGA